MASVTAVPRLGAGGGRRTGRLRLTLRLAVELFVLAVLITAACAWTAIVLVDQTFRLLKEDELEAMATGADRALDIRRRAVERSVEELQDSLVSDPELLERILLEDPQLADEAARWMNSFQLRMLDVLNEEGKVLSSGHQPERIGLTDETFRQIQAQGSELRRVKISGEPTTALVARRDRQVGLRRLILVGGSDLDRPFVEQVAGREAALLIERDRDGQPHAAASATAEALWPSGVSSLLAADSSGPVRVRDRDGQPWLATYRGIGEEGAPQTALILAVDLTSTEALRRKLVEAFVLLGLGVGGVAALAGVWIARRIARPVRGLVTAFDAIARGEADYSFGIRAHDEMQEVVTSFSRLHGAFEDQRRRSMASERVAAWREVARHVAHEVKNPLAPIRLTVENLLRARTQAPEKFDAMFREGMQTILEEVQQLSRMVSEFAEFARLPLPVLEPVVLEELIDRVIELYASEPGVAIRRKVAAGMPAVELDADQVSRALKNVVGNAIEAARERTTFEPGIGPEIEIRARPLEGMAQIEVVDNGPGLSEEAERRLFEPYFTTKPHGVGLGMALTYRIVIEHGGVIFAENLPDLGARVVIRLPLGARESNGARVRAEDPG